MTTMLFVGGGSLGHLMPCIAVAEAVRAKTPDTCIVFVSADRPEETDYLRAHGQRFHALRAPKSPRTLSPATLLFPMRFVIACVHARNILLREKPDLIFSKGGFVSVPVCLMARMQGIPIVMHESDSVLSLGARLVSTFAKKVCTGFPLPSSGHAEHTGNPVRSDILRGAESAGRRITGFSGRRPVVMIIGGSQGSVAMNQAVTSSLDVLLSVADIIHLTGRGKMTTKSHARYFVQEIVTDDLPHLYALATLVVTRAGAGVLSELGALSKAAIVVPLTGAGHDHQLRNAEVLSQSGAVVLLRQEELHRLPSLAQELLSDGVKRQNLGAALAHAFPPDATSRIATILLAEISPSRIQS